VRDTAPTLWLVAGPNGVGKTTYAYRHIRAVAGSVHFVNLDEIARGLSPLAPEVARNAAARVAIERARELMAARVSFTIVTTLAGRTDLQTMTQARAAGFGINLLYFIVLDVSTCLVRIARRVSEGGHDVPEADVRRRFERSVHNFATCASAVTLWRVMDNAAANPRTAAEGRGGCVAMKGDLVGLPPALASAITAFPPCSEG